MEADSTTYNDLNIFHQEEHFSIFNKLNFTKTAEGSHWLRTYLQEAICH